MRASEHKRPVVPAELRSGKRRSAVLSVRVLSLLLGGMFALALPISAASGSPIASPSAGGGTGAAAHVGFNWGQYQGSGAHNGVTGVTGPTSGKIAWVDAGAGGALPIVASGTTAMLSSYPSGWIGEVNTGNGSWVTNLSGNVQSSELAIASGALYFAQEYTYSCGWFCSASSSEIVSYNYATGATNWAWGAPSTEWRWLLSEGNGYVFAGVPGSSTLYGLVGSTGALSWSANVGYGITTLPTYGAGLVAVGSSDSANVSALNYFNGSAVWSFAPDAPVVSPAITFAGGHFYFGTSAGTLYDLTSKGKVHWKFHTHGLAIDTTPTVSGGLVLFGAGTQLFAVNAGSGKLAWNVTLGGAADVSPVVSSHAKIVYVGDGAGDLYALKEKNGAKIWTLNLGAGISDGIVVGRHVLLVSNVNGYVFEIASKGHAKVPHQVGADWEQYGGSAGHTGASLSAGPTNGTLLWNASTGASSPGLTAVGNSLLAASYSNGTLEQWNLETRSLESANLASGSIYSTYPVQGATGEDTYYVQYYSYSCGWFCTSTGSELVDDVYDQAPPGGGWVPWAAGYGLTTSWGVAESNGTIYVDILGGTTLYALAADSGATLWATSFSAPISTMPTVSDGLVAVAFSTTANVSAVYASNGTAAWTYTMNAPAGASVTASAGTFYAGSTLGTLYAIAANGSGVWSYKDKALSGITTAASVADGFVYFGSANGYLYQVGALNGSKGWIDHLGGSVSASPVVGTNGLLFTGNSNGIVSALDTSNGTLLWKYALPSAVGDGLLLSGGLLIVPAASGTISVF